MPGDPKILIAIFHVPGKNDENFEKLKLVFSGFDIYVPEVNYYGRKWESTKAYFIANSYDSLFLICSDVSIVCGDITRMIQQYAINESVGVYGFGTIDNCTFPWLRYNNLEGQKQVPFVEGYCFGINKILLPCLEHDNVYGYGIDVELGYRSYENGLTAILSNEVCISHAYGKSYDDMEASREYCNFLMSYPSIHQYLKALNIYTPI